MTAGPTVERTRRYLLTGTTSPWNARTRDGEVLRLAYTHAGVRGSATITRAALAAAERELGHELSPRPEYPRAGFDPDARR